MTRFLAPSPGQWLSFSGALLMNAGVLCESGSIQMAPFPLPAGTMPDVWHALLHDPGPSVAWLSHTSATLPGQSVQLLSTALIVWGPKDFLVCLIVGWLVYFELGHTVFIFAHFISISMCLKCKEGFSMSIPSLLLTKTICHFIYGNFVVV